MRRPGWIVLAAFMVASPCWAGEFHYGGKVEGIYNNNLLASPTDEIQDGSFRGTPFGELEDQTGKLQWNLRYAPSYEQFISHTELSGWDQDVNAGLSWEITPTLALNLSDRFDRFHSFNRFNQATGGTAVVIADQRNPFNQNTASASLDFRVSPTQVFTVFGDHYLWNFSGGSRRRDQQTMDAGVQYLQTMSERLRIGPTVSWSRQYFAPTDLLSSTKTDYYHVAGNMIYTFDPTLLVRLSAGPTLVVSPSTPSPPSSATVAVVPLRAKGNGRQPLNVATCPTLSDGTPFLVNVNSCDPLPITFTDPNVISVIGGPQQVVFFTGSVPSTGGSDLTYFANASIEKVWENWTFSLSYQRQANQSAGVGTSSIADVVYGRIHWHPTARWNLDLGSSWIQRSQQGSSSTTVVGVMPIDTSACPPPPAVSLLPQCVLALFPNTAQAAETASLRGVKVSNSATIVTYNVRGYAGYRLTKRITLFGLANWYGTQTSASYVKTETVNQFSIWTGIQYEFEPIHF